MMAQTFKVAGMTCGHCVTSVTDSLSKLAGVEHVKVDLSDGVVTVRSKHHLAGPEVAKAIDDAGYELIAP
jgi:copper chaperone